MKKTLTALLLALAMVLPLCLTACGPKDGPVYTEEDIYTPGEYDSVWNTIGDKVTIDKVTLGSDGHTATTTVDGKTYELGMDFLSMAMVYSCAPISGNSKFDTADKIYNEWFKLYMLRWNYLLPEVPLYSNIYYDVYNAQKITKGTLRTNAYWSPADAILSSTPVSGTTSVTLGSSTELSGLFHSASFRKSSPGSSDLDIQGLTHAYDTISTHDDGGYYWANEKVVKSHSEKENDDGTKTFTIEIASGLKFSDGSAINAKNYIVSILAASSPIYKEAGNSDAGGQTYVGWSEYKGYDGTNASASVKKEFSGVRLLSDYKFSVTIAADYLPYYYDMTYAAFGPSPLQLYLPASCDIKDDGNGAYIDGAAFYAKDSDGFAQADVIKENMTKSVMKGSGSIPCSGPYYVDSYDDSTKTATLKVNEYFDCSADYRLGSNSSVPYATLVYTKVISETQTEQFSTGLVDILATLTGADDIAAALAVVNGNSTKYAENHYNRAGYGKMGFRGDFGPVMFEEVRQAIAYTIDRNAFAQAFTGGYGSAVNGPYSQGVAGYEANKSFFEANLLPYSMSADAAIQILEQGGWTYGANGKAYKSGIRYKKLAKEEQTEFNLAYHSQDNKYKTVKVGDSFYMPLVLNWFGTSDNPFSDLLISSWVNANILKDIGMEVQYTLGDFSQALYGELGQDTEYGWNGDAVYSVFNYATGFTSTIYDYSWNWTIDADLFDAYSICYIKDAADYVYAK